VPQRRSSLAQKLNQGIPVVSRLTLWAMVDFQRVVGTVRPSLSNNGTDSDVQARPEKKTRLRRLAESTRCSGLANAKAKGKSLGRLTSCRLFTSGERAVAFGPGKNLSGSFPTDGRERFSTYSGEAGKEETSGRRVKQSGHLRNDLRGRAYVGVNPFSAS